MAMITQEKGNVYLIVSNYIATERKILPYQAE